MSLIENREKPPAVFVIERLVHRDAELARWWAERAELGGPVAGEPHDGEDLVRAVLDAAVDEERPREALTDHGRTMGAAAHRWGVSLRRMLEELDLLQEILLRAAEQAAADLAGDGGVTTGLAAARCIGGAVSSVRLAAVEAYGEAVEDDLRTRYRAIRHDLRNPLGTIKSAVALLTDESVPAELRQSSRVRAMVARNANSMDRMIADVLGDDAARLAAFATAGAAAVAETSRRSRRKQRDDLSSAS